MAVEIFQPTDNASDRTDHMVESREGFLWRGTAVTGFWPAALRQRSNIDRSRQPVTLGLAANWALRPARHRVQPAHDRQRIECEQRGVETARSSSAPAHDVASHH